MGIKKNKRSTITINCEHCNVEFNKTTSEYIRSVKLGRKHYCSLNCSKESNKVSIKQCLCCGKEFTPPKKDSKFCSRSCSVRHSNKNRNGEKRNFSSVGLNNILLANEKKHNTKEKRKSYNQSPKYCKYCDKLIPYEKRRNVFCDIDCRREYGKRNMSEYQKYYRLCQFSFPLNNYCDEFNFKLIEEYGWYSPTNKNNNIAGVSRDHIYSIREGYENNIDPDIIKHPANCQLMRHSENISKNRKSNISLNDLKKKINEWNLKY